MSNLNLDPANISKMLEGLSKEEREATLQILKQYADDGSSDLFQQLKYADWEEVPVDIHTFLHEKRFLGNGLYDNEGRFTVYPFWEETLEKIFPDNVSTAYNTVVLTGAIGIGKSFVADIILLYMLYRLLCLKDPYSYFGLQPIDKLSISMVNITLKNARDVALDKMNQLLLSSEWFLAHGEMGGITNLTYHPNKHIEIVLASSNNQIIGRCLFANFVDEINFSLIQDVEKAKKKAMMLITQVDARQRSRFLRGTYLPTMNIIASSKNSEQSFLEDYIKRKKENESTTTLIVDKPQWIVDSRKDSPKKFWVAIGNKLLANELLPVDADEGLVDEFRRKGYDMWQVPIGYLETFQNNVDEAICSIIGIATASTLKFLSGARLEQIKTDSYQNPFVKDIIEVGNSPDDHLQYMNFFDMSRVDPSDIGRPMFIHLDMSVSNDKTGIAGVWITGRRQNQIVTATSEQYELGVENSSLLNRDEDVSSRELQFKTAFSVSIKAPKKWQVDFEKTRKFLLWLREKGFNVCMLSSDTYMSVPFQQRLKADGFRFDTLSVDRVDFHTKVCEPYAYLKSAIYDRQLILYQKCDLLTEELINLERESSGKINHPENGKYGSKDQADALCGSVYEASKYADEYSYNYGDNLAASLDVTLDEDGDSPETRKRQFILSFQDELAKLYAEIDESTASNARADAESAADIADGIIVI